jgi:hypothetical protein
MAEQRRIYKHEIYAINICLIKVDLKILKTIFIYSLCQKQIHHTNQAKPNLVKFTVPGIPVHLPCSTYGPQHLVLQNSFHILV